ncbi:hypothetical protein B0T16DRAFT_198728 [Cercophora newfieldiana]|uniref:Uncharacterized protein n=1 Tax=Cercophora newfieldiana TaxID=92897 RepID=A0AA39Y4X1_9PEZI|nr:hypothetical protein B0T16DRAFT_198728 [Cercophora newfieldiana]
MYRPLAIDKHCQVPIFPAVNARLAAIDKASHASHAPKRVPDSGLAAIGTPDSVPRSAPGNRAIPPQLGHGSSPPHACPCLPISPLA